MESIITWSQRAKCVKEGVFQENIPDKKYCTGCLVKGLCNTYAIVHGERGIWGGTSEYERKKVDSETKNILKEAYREAGLLESRSVDPLKSLKQSGVLPQVHIAPNVLLVFDVDPTLYRSA